MKVGLVTSSSRATPSPLMIPLVIVVLPLPSSPDRRISEGGRRRSANLRPTSIVCSGEEDTISVDDIVPLNQKPGIGLRKRLDKIRRHERGLANSFRRNVASQTVEIDTESEHVFPIFTTKFGC